MFWPPLPMMIDASCVTMSERIDMVGAGLSTAGSVEAADCTGAAGSEAAADVDATGGASSRSSASEVSKLV